MGRGAEAGTDKREKGRGEVPWLEMTKGKRGREVALGSVVTRGTRDGERRIGWK